MDESFPFRARRLAGPPEPAALDYSLLTATLAARQAASAAAGAQGRAARQTDGAGDPLSEILLSGPDWKSAAGVQRGCFNRAEARHRLNLR
jgi:hypothetical protein